MAVEVLRYVLQKYLGIFNYTFPIEIINLFVLKAIIYIIIQMVQLLLTHCVLTVIGCFLYNLKASLTSLAFDQSIVLYHYYV